MNAWEGLLAGPSGDFPRGPGNNVLPGRPWLAALLLVLCLVPRSVAAWNWDVLWGDSLRYRYASICLEQGDFEQGFAEFGLNIYPLILIPLRHLGIDWQITGKAFGVIIASLTVLPLWGWVRRMFNDRLAVIACCVYALHGKLIAVSLLILRDSTFWFVLVLCLYYLWRAIGELRGRLYLAAGAAMTLAVHTRTEGWLLLIPLVGWSACRWPSARGQRLRLIFGAWLCLAVIPAAVTVVNFTWLRDNPRWEFLRTSHIQLAVDWWNSATGMNVRVPCPEGLPPPQIGIPQSGESDGDGPAPSYVTPTTGPPQPARQSAPPFSSIYLPAAVPPEQTTSSWILTFKLLERLAKGFTWVGSVLLLVGLLGGWRIFLRPVNMTMLCVNVMLLLITRVRYGIAGIDQRYFMPTVIVSVPWIALGLDYAIARARRWGHFRGADSPRAARMIAGGLIALVVALSFVDGPISTPAYMRKHADLGRWIRRHAGPGPAIGGNVDQMSLEEFYANGHVVGIFWPRDCLLVPLPAALTSRSADVVVLWNDDNNIAPEYLPIIEKRLTGYCGYRRVDPKDLPVAEGDVMVFVTR
jgi:hypothetical protein